MAKKDLTDTDVQTALGLIPEMRICAQCKHCIKAYAGPLCKKSPREFIVDPVSGDPRYRWEDGKYYSGNSASNRYYECCTINRDGKCSLWEVKEPMRLHFAALTVGVIVISIIFGAVIYFK